MVVHDCPIMLILMLNAKCGSMRLIVHVHVYEYPTGQGVIKNVYLLQTLTSVTTARLTVNTRVSTRTAATTVTAPLDTPSTTTGGRVLKVTFTDGIKFCLVVVPCLWLNTNSSPDV